MPNSSVRTYSRRTKASAALLGNLIRAARLHAGLTAEIVAERAGLSRPLLRRIENGDLSVSLGAAFEAAVTVGLILFEDDPSRLADAGRNTATLLKLLPKRAGTSLKAVKDDF